MYKAVLDLIHKGHMNGAAYSSLNYNNPQHEDSHRISTLPHLIPLLILTLLYKMKSVELHLPNAELY